MFFFLLENILFRRHLPPQQRAMLAHRTGPLFSTFLTMLSSVDPFLSILDPFFSTFLPMFTLFSQFVSICPPKFNFFIASLSCSSPLSSLPIFGLIITVPLRPVQNFIWICVRNFPERDIISISVSFLSKTFKDTLKNSYRGKEIPDLWQPDRSMPSMRRSPLLQS